MCVRTHIAENIVFFLLYKARVKWKLIYIHLQNSFHVKHSIKKKKLIQLKKKKQDFIYNFCIL